MVFCCRCWTVMEHGLIAQESPLRVFTLAELQKAAFEFKKSSETGECLFGSVYMGIVTSLTHPYNNFKVAVKLVIRPNMEKIRLHEELRLLENIKHQNLVKLIGYYIEASGNEMHLVYEYLSNGSLNRHLSSLPWSMRLRIAKDVANGLAYLHDEMIIFKDFKPTNILLDDRMKAKLLYLGFVRKTPQHGTRAVTSVVGTRGQAAPELIKKGRETTKMDVWSYGVFLLELITGGIPVAEENQENNPECMRWVCCQGAGMSTLRVDPMLEGKYSQKSLRKVTSIVNKCLVLEPKRRPKMSLVLKLVKEAINLEISS